MNKTAVNKKCIILSEVSMLPIPGLFDGKCNDVYFAGDDGNIYQKVETNIKFTSTSKTNPGYNLFEFAENRIYKRMKLQSNKSIMPFVHLYHNGRTKVYSAARLIARAYHGERNHFFKVRYRNDKQNDIRPENLEWILPKRITLGEIFSDEELNLWNGYTDLYERDAEEAAVLKFMELYNKKAAVELYPDIKLLITKFFK